MVNSLVISEAKLKQLALSSGLSLVEILSIDQVESSLSKNAFHLKLWQDHGYAGEMSYMLRPPEMFSGLNHILPGAKSVVCFVISYFNSQSHVPKAGYGRVARYAWGKDYHRVLKRRLKLLVEKVEKELLIKNQDNFSWRVFSDAVPLLERSLSANSRLGFVGKNGMVIRPGLGSYTFLAEIIWNVKVNTQAQSGINLTLEKPGKACKTCSRCLNSCPTQAFTGPGVLDARKCISYLTIEKRTLLDDWESRAITDWIFGCDVCQEVCPFNHQGIKESAEDEFALSQGPGPYLDLIALLEITSSQDFVNQFAGTALMRAGLEQLKRNACCIIANSNFFNAIPVLIHSMKEDHSPLVRSQALEALKRLFEPSEGLDRIRLKSVLASFRT